MEAEKKSTRSGLLTNSEGKLHLERIVTWTLILLLLVLSGIFFGTKTNTDQKMILLADVKERVTKEKSEILARMENQSIISENLRLELEARLEEIKNIEKELDEAILKGDAIIQEKLLEKNKRRELERINKQLEELLMKGNADKEELGRLRDSVQQYRTMVQRLNTELITLKGVKPDQIKVPLAIENFNFDFRENGGNKSLKISLTREGKKEFKAKKCIGIDFTFDIAPRSEITDKGMKEISIIIYNSENEKVANVSTTRNYTGSSIRGISLKISKREFSKMAPGKHVIEVLIDKEKAYSDSFTFK